MASRRYRRLPSGSVSYSEILNISAQSGSILDRWGNTLTNNTTTVFKDAEVYAMNFDGSSSVQVGGAGDCQPESITAIAWVKRPDDDSGPAVQSILTNGDGSSYGYGLAYDATNNEWRFAIDPNGGVGVYTGINSDDKVVAGKWYLLIGTYDAVSNEMELYVDDVQQSGSTTVAQIDYDPTENTIIGAFDGGGGGYIGLINDVRLKDNVLTRNELSQIFSSEVGRYR